ncbi:MAG: hypothetical protein ACRC2R_05165 [Xenococcaceae cyanobacterium]
MSTKIINNLGEKNPQLFRELKGKLKQRNLAIAALISVFFQSLIYLYFESLLPSGDGKYSSVYSSYCTSENDYKGIECIKDLLGNWMVDWQRWWLDLFSSISAIGIIVLLTVGTYMLIADLSKEDSKGTLNFVRLSPQNATNILIGKMIGVPILLYLVAISFLPLHLGAGLAAGIPINLLITFYLVLTASCIFFYSLALLLGLINFGLGEFSYLGLAGFKPWLGSGFVLGFLSLMTTASNSGAIATKTLFDWIALFYPGVILSYLVKATYLPVSHYSSSNNLENLLFYGQSFWKNPLTGSGFIILNYVVATYWIWQSLPHRFDNPNCTLLTKTQSYWLSGCCVAIATGFTFQTISTYDDYYLYGNFGLLQFSLVVFFLCLTAALSPHRQTLQDWARYRHQNEDRRNDFWKDLVLGQKSPAIVAIALNLGIVTIYLLPALFIFNLGEDRIPALLGLLLTVSTIFIYASLAQLMLMMRAKTRAIWAAVTVGSAIAIPMGLIFLFGMSPDRHPWLFLFSFIPSVATPSAATTSVAIALMGQWLAIALINLQMTRQLRQAGASTSKMLFNSSSII